MKVKCVSCGKEFTVEKITELINVCDKCKDKAFNLPEGFEALFGGRK